MSNVRRETSISSGEETAIDLYSMIMDVVKEWFSILLLTIAAGLVAYVALSNLRPLDYATTATMVVRNINEENNSGNTGTDVYENLNYGADSASRLKNILESRELKDTVAKELGLKAVEAMEGGRSAALLANHGAVCWGRNMKEALATAQVLEKAAQIYCIAHSFGSSFPLNETTVNTLHDFYLNHYSKRQRGEE